MTEDLSGHEEIPLDLPEKDILFLALEAHKLGITLNEHMVNIVKQAIDHELAKDDHLDPYY